MSRFFVAVIAMVLLSGCDVAVPAADNKFGKQNFVSAVALIELHKRRNGNYPETLGELEFLGDWDQIWLSAVRYEKNGNGYNLYVERGWVGTPNLELPVKFKQGLGINETNVTWSSVK